MLIPNLPPAGAQQDAFKPDRKIRPGAIEGVPGDPLSELPVDDSGSKGGHQQSAGEQPSPAPELESEQPPAVKAAPGGAADLPRKGLLVDIRA
ncbi:hypothetical protein DHB74_08475 [Pseudomonas sp. G11-1]|uniref:Uncharacterized protein n=1 Tax=Halopseudomonas bauzanensis TaxID=653930 RepID=A0A031MFW6_9GAMM|nr:MULTISPECIES: hypothetical protein [Halopseudomonas]MCO5786381.1 hypothetical protein [Pseudomonas sp. G11-1]MCO5789607.1 hypothetical protein [Pseudomonas sp. G11-2]EZQ18890.1 hypothetical protein CF98_16370 [Halopseudomonas bauzanensis]TKA92441.1 hypothetical protein FA869_08640 [Halopseudomonas bauzanensis]WGK62697.1 hypothetical protein QAO71_05525 [Halopseudomonas sp. SMJS2]